MKIKRPTPMLLALLGSLLASSVAGQQPEKLEVRGGKALESACDGAWLRVQATVMALSHMPENALDRAERVRVTCLLDAIGRTTFDADPQIDDLYTHSAVSTLVGVYGPAGYDFFASEYARHSARVQRALDAALFGRGHPDAFRRYFETRRSHDARRESPTPSVAASPAVWSPVIERGTCSKELCSSRIEETLQLVRKNLDMVDADLALTESVEPSSLSSDALEAARKTRSSARHLREMIGRIRRGEVVMGPIQ
ncbi:MAG TPA: hypothetical protein VGD79_03010 [Thermoanaerobaculia bacterium]|jgi:hypothetical protein